MECNYDLLQIRKTSVDIFSFVFNLVVRIRFVDALTACQVDEVQFT